MYRDDPTIIAWNLINEPRCESWLAANKDCNKRVQAWISEMSSHVRGLDPNHLITIGSEGFYGDSTPSLLQYNPQAWASDLGQDFVANTNIKDIDFATVHAWPDNWMLAQVRRGECAPRARCCAWLGSRERGCVCVHAVRRVVVFVVCVPWGSGGQSGSRRHGSGSSMHARTHTLHNKRAPQVTSQHYAAARTHAHSTGASRPRTASPPPHATRRRAQHMHARTHASGSAIALASACARALPCCARTPFPF